MSDPDCIVELSAEDPKRLAAAVSAVVTEDDERAARLRKGAQQSVAEDPEDTATARRFQTLLELGYLVASADGFADAERNTLAEILETVTGAAVDHATLTLHFLDLDEAVSSLGRRERLARAASELEDAAAAEEAIGLAALIAMADGRVSQLELQVLVELGEHASVKADRVEALIREMASRVEEKLR